ncbi:hypothetical protein CA297_23290, partial [Salmonella enterica subsp. enterica serovar Enteritidis]
MAVIVTLSARPRGRRHVKLGAGLQVGKAAGGRGGPGQFFFRWGGQGVGPRHRLPLFLGVRDGAGAGGGGRP